MSQQVFIRAQKPSKSTTPKSNGALQRKCDKCSEKKPLLQRSAIGPASDVPPVGHEVLRSPGVRFDPAARTSIEPRFAFEFSRVPLYPKSSPNIQAKLAVNTPGDIYEQEADRVADQMIATPAYTAAGGAQPHIQRFSGQLNGQVDAAPTSVDQVLASSGRPLEPALRRDMEGRFDHDFSRVRVHLGSAAEQSAREVNALAYTVGHNIAFDEGRFAPSTHEGRRLIAHELTHVVQQSEATGIRVGQDNEKRDLSLISTALHLQRKNDKKTDIDPVVELKQVGDIWHLKLRGFTDVKAAERRIWSSKTPKGVKITLLATEEKPEKIGTFELSGITLEALKTMNSPFESWFDVSGMDWDADGLKKLLDVCDGGLGIWSKTKKANGGKDPKITLGQSDYTDSKTGEITLDKSVDKCRAVQALVHELTNRSSSVEINKIITSAAAGDLSRDEFIRGMEKVEYDFGVKNVLTAYNACKDKWLCKTSIMEFASKAKDFEDYFKNLLLPAHKENYGKQWDDKFKKDYEKKHPKK